MLPEECLGCPGLSQLCRSWELLLLRKETYYKPVSSCVRALRSSLGEVRAGECWQWCRTGLCACSCRRALLLCAETELAQHRGQA